MAYYVLSLDASVKALRGAIFESDTLNLVTSKQIVFDDLKEYGTRNGCFTLGDVSKSPTELLVKAFDLLLEAFQSSQVDLHRIRSISGACQQHASVWWSTKGLQSLSNLDHRERLSSQLNNAKSSWSLNDPPNCCDSSTAEQARQLDERIEEFESVRRVGTRIQYRFTALQIMKLRQTKPGLMEQTERISLMSSFLASLFLGRVAPIDEADACSTGLYNVYRSCWDERVCSVVMGDDRLTIVTGDQGSVEIDVPGPSPGAENLMAKLGTVERDGGKALGRVDPYFVRRYDFAPECIVCTFTGDNPATTLSCVLRPDDALVCLGLGNTDTLITLSPAYVPDPTRHFWPHPARMPRPGDETLIGGDPGRFICMFSWKDAGLARSFVKDAFCNSQWDVFNHLMEITPLGGSIGLDDKNFLFFWPHGERGLWKGMSRFEAGRRVTEFTDGRINPRVLLESSFLSMRIKLARLSTDNLNRAKPPKHVDSIGFDPWDRNILPKRLIAVGGASINPLVLKILSECLGSPVHTLTGAPKWRMPSSILGAANKAAWCLARANFGDSVVGSFEGFLAKVKPATGGLDLVEDTLELDEDLVERYGSLVHEYCRLEDGLNKGHL